MLAQVTLHGKLLAADVARWPRTGAVRFHVRPQRVSGLQLRPADGANDRLELLATQSLVLFPGVRTEERLRAAFGLTLERSNSVVLIHVIAELDLVCEYSSALLAILHSYR